MRPEAGDRRLLAPLQRRRIEARFGDAATQWLQALPPRLVAAEARWGFRVVEPLVPGGHSGCIYRARMDDGRAAVMKISFELAETVDEARVVGYWRRHGVERVAEIYAHDGDEILYEALEPSRQLSQLPDSPALEQELATMLQDLHVRCDDDSFPTVRPWFERYVKGGDYGPLVQNGLVEPALVERTLDLGDELLDSLAAPVLVHGDLHGDNALDVSGRGYHVVDPRGYRSEGAYEVAVWSGKRGREEDVGPRAARLGRLLGLDQERVEGWARVLALDSAKMYQQLDPGPRVAQLCAYLRRFR